MHFISNNIVNNSALMHCVIKPIDAVFAAYATPKIIKVVTYLLEGADATKLLHITLGVSIKGANYLLLSKAFYLSANFSPF